MLTVVKVYIEYAKANNLVAVAVYLVALVASQATNMGGSVWLKKWAEYNAGNGGNFHVGKYIGVYFAFGIGGALLTAAQMLILWILCSIEVCSPSRSKTGSMVSVVG